MKSTGTNTTETQVAGGVRHQSLHQNTKHGRTHTISSRHPGSHPSMIVIDGISLPAPPQIAKKHPNEFFGGMPG